MTEPIDEAAAVEWAGVVQWCEAAMEDDKNLARAALWWKARAEAAEERIEAFKRELKGVYKRK